LFIAEPALVPFESVEHLSDVVKFWANQLGKPKPNKEKVCNALYLDWGDPPLSQGLPTSRLSTA
jgi:hypothetical protein